MRKLILPMITLILVCFLGCSSSPIEPTRNPAGIDAEQMVFQLAAVLACPDLECPSAVPTNVPLSQVIPEENFRLFAIFALTAFNVYDESGDWNDLSDKDLEDIQRSVLYNPADWDGWIPGSGSSVQRRAFSDGDPSNWLEEIGQRIDPEGLFDYDDWLKWLGLMYEPADWDDWLLTHTIDDIAALN